METGGHQSGDRGGEGLELGVVVDHRRAEVGEERAVREAVEPVQVCIPWVVVSEAPVAAPGRAKIERLPN